MKDFDELLDQVLKEEARVEPRLGFEERILAGLRVEASRKRWLRIWWVPAGVFAGLAVSAALMVQHGRSDAHSAAANPGVSQAGRASLPAPEKVRKVFETETLSPDHRSAPPLLPRRRAEGRTASQMGQGEAVGESRLPKMETFPAVAQSGGFLPEPVMTSGEGGKLREVLDSPQVAQALLELKAKQERPLEVSAIEIEPL
jgi:hypothetical protein